MPVEGACMTRVTLGLPRMHKEAAELRDFLPALVSVAADAGAQVVIERGLGTGMGISEEEYRRAAGGSLKVVDTREESWTQDIVLVLRSPEVEEFDRLVRPGSTVVSMLHLPTRPRRVERLRALGASAVSLDGLVDDNGRRLVENLRSVAWNGLHCAFTAMESVFPWRLSPEAGVLRVTVLGPGRVGRHALSAAIKYGERDRWREWSARGVPPVMATVLGRRLTGAPMFLRQHLAMTDVLVDATQRERPDQPVIRNEALSALPKHADRLLPFGASRESRWDHSTSGCSRRTIRPGPRPSRRACLTPNGVRSSAATRGPEFGRASAWSITDDNWHHCGAG